MDTRTKTHVVDSLVSELNEKGKNIPTEITEFHSLPYQSFAELISALENGEAALQRLSVNMETAFFSIAATGFDKAQFQLGIVAGYGSVLAGIVLAAIFSWWLIFLVPVGYVLGASVAKSAYNRTILSVAESSETAFCFLYFIGQIYVLRCSDNQRYFHRAA